MYKSSRLLPMFVRTEESDLGDEESGLERGVGNAKVKGIVGEEMAAHGVRDFAASAPPV